jgi:hypothetical protein
MSPQILVILVAALTTVMVTMAIATNQSRGAKPQRTRLSGALAVGGAIVLIALLLVFVAGS